MKHRTNKLFTGNKYKFMDLFFIALAVITILTSTLHFWPFQDNKIWQMLNAPNLCCGIALLLATYLSISKKEQHTTSLYMPHISILAYLVINIFSLSFADTLSRPLNYTIKLALVFTGGLFLFQKALSNPRVLKFFYILIAAAVSISISVCIYTRLFCDPKQFGFHSNVFKYGTYIGILVPLSCVYLFSGSKWQILLAVLIATAGIFSAGSAGAVLSIFAGLFIGFVLSKRSSVKTYIFICLLLSAAALSFSNRIFNGTIGKDFALKEIDKINLRQRYIEWQAQINLMEKRGITGTGAGCINDYRSNFYYRLPKLNTLKAFDQNSFTAIAAETGLLGLATFIWILIYYGRISLRNTLHPKADQHAQAHAMATANTAGFVSAITANVFSSVHYNGTLIVFVLLLSLISSSNRIYGGIASED